MHGWVGLSFFFHLWKPVPYSYYSLHGLSPVSQSYNEIRVKKNIPKRAGGCKINIKIRWLWYYLCEDFCASKIWLGKLNKVQISGNGLNVRIRGHRKNYSDLSSAVQCYHNQLAILSIIFWDITISNESTWLTDNSP